MEVKLIKEMTGKELIKELESTYGSLNKLKRTYKRNKNNMKLYTDLEDWKYFLKNPNEKAKQSKVVYTDDLSLGKIEFEILNQIKNKEPRSVNELSNYIDRDTSSVLRKVNELEKQGLLTFEKGFKNSKKPVLGYDMIEIVI